MENLLRRWHVARVLASRATEHLRRRRARASTATNGTLPNRLSPNSYMRLLHRQALGAVASTRRSSSRLLHPLGWKTIPSHLLRLRKFPLSLCHRHTSRKISFRASTRMIGCRSMEGPPFLNQFSTRRSAVARTAHHALLRVPSRSTSLTFYALHYISMYLSSTGQ